MLIYMKEFRYFVDGDLSDKFHKAVHGIKQLINLWELHNMASLMTEWQVGALILEPLTKL